MKKTLFIVLVLLKIGIIVGQSQIHDPVNWSYYSEKVNKNTVNLVFEATVEEGWYIYDIEPHGDINSTLFEFNTSKGYKKIGGIAGYSSYKEKQDELSGATIRVYPEKAVFKQKINVTAEKPFAIEGSITYFACTDRMCTPPMEDKFTFNLEGKSGITALKKEKTETIQEQPREKENNKQGSNESAMKHDFLDIFGQEKKNDTSSERQVIDKSPGEESPRAADQKKGGQSLWWIIWTSFIGGLGAILTPCVYPMIPLTVSFFMQGTRSRAASVTRGAFFGFSIVLIYTLVGVIAAFFGARFTDTLSEHWIPNMAFFLFFVIFALSFFGLFEITLPSGLANKLDKQADRGGMIGLLFIALTTVIVSFSCTGPIVGSLLFEAVSGGFTQPVIGMFAFGLAFALPFTLFAIFPGIMKDLPKSGGWLNSVKVVLGFLILALGFKFLVIANNSIDLGLKREVVLAFWIVIFFMLGLYLLGKIKMPHDPGIKHVSVFRLFLSMFSFVFAIYLLPGMFGAPLKSFEAYLPGESLYQHHPFKIKGYTSSDQNNKPGLYDTCEKPLHADVFEYKYGLQGFYDHDQALLCAKKVNKPVLLYFKSINCANCKIMEAKVWSDPRVYKLLQQYVIASLYTGTRANQQKLPPGEWFNLEYSDKQVKTLGGKNREIERKMFKTNAMPYFAVVNPSGKILIDPVAYEPDVEKYMAFLKKGLKAYNY